MEAFHRSAEEMPDERIPVDTLYRVRGAKLDYLRTLALVAPVAREPAGRHGSSQP